MPATGIVPRLSSLSFPLGGDPVPGVTLLNVPPLAPRRSGADPRSARRSSGEAPAGPQVGRDQTVLSRRASNASSRRRSRATDSTPTANNGGDSPKAAVPRLRSPENRVPRHCSGGVLTARQRTSPDSARASPAGPQRPPAGSSPTPTAGGECSGGDSSAEASPRRRSPEDRVPRHCSGGVVAARRRKSPDQNAPSNRTGPVGGRRLSRPVASAGAPPTPSDDSVDTPAPSASPPPPTARHPSLAGLGSEATAATASGGGGGSENPARLTIPLSSPRKVSGEGLPPRSPQAPTATARAGSAASYARCKLEAERRMSAVRCGVPVSQRDPPRSAPQHPRSSSQPSVPDLDGDHPAQVSPAADDAVHPRKFRGMTLTIPRLSVEAGGAASPGPSGPQPSLPSQPSSSSFGPSDVDSLDSPLYATLPNTPLTGDSRPPSSPQSPSLHSLHSPHSPHSPLTRRRNACAPPPSATPPTTKVSAALDEEDLAVPWKEAEKLTKLTSCMLRMGLQFGVAAAETPMSPLLSPLTTSRRQDSLTWEDGAGGEAEANPRLRIVLRHEMHRIQEVQDRIERRDQRREWARLQAEDQRHREVKTLRAAMWLTIVGVHARSLPHLIAARSSANTMTRLLIPVWRMYVFRAKRRRAREQALAQAVRTVRRLTPHQLRGTGPLFQDWPEELLAAFAGELQLCPFAAGEYICHQGDPSGLLYLLAAGTVDVVLRRPDCAGKARGKRTGLTVAQLAPIRYVGEYGVFAGEPRAATLYCATPVVAWVAAKPVLVWYLQRVPAPVYRGICAAFEASMATIYKVRSAQLASTVLFRDWDLPTLEEVVAKLQPVLFPENAVLLEAGAPGAAVYIVAKGRCRATAVTGSPAAAVELAAGALLGLRACVFVEGQECEVRALTTVQAWRLPKAVLMDFLLLRPDRFLAAKRRLNAELAGALVKPPPEDLFADSPVAALPRKVRQQLYARLRPLVVDPGAEEAGEGADQLWFGVHGVSVVGDDRSTASLTPGWCPGTDLVAHAAPRRVAGQATPAKGLVGGWRLTLADLVAVLEVQGGALPPGTMRSPAAVIDALGRQP